MKNSNFFIIKAIFIPIILLGSLAVAYIFTHLHVRQEAAQFEDVFRTQNVKALAESDIFALSNNLGQIVGKFNFKCLSAKNNDIIFMQNGPNNCHPNLFEARGNLTSSSKKVSIEYVLQLPSSWYYLSVGLILIQAILAIALLIVSSKYEKRIIEEERSKAKALLDQSKQVAHDIRSPLAVINSSKFDDVLALQAVQRLNDIASNLLGKSSKKLTTIDKVTEQILSEKRLEFPNVEFKSINSSQDIISSDGVLLSRILSNIINNAAEVSSIVTVEVASNKISVKDNGPGIPQEVIDSLASNIGMTTKPDGNGIGLLHAKEESSKLGAELSITKLDTGTEVSLIWDHKFEHKVILVEDDSLITKYWQLESKKNGIRLIAFSSSQTLLENLKHHDSNSLFFLDQDISDTDKGSDLALKLYERGYRNIYICSGHEATTFSSVQDIIKGSIGKDFPLDIIRSHMHL